MKKKIIAIGSDHAGYTLKEEIKQFLLSSGYALKDLGTHTTESTDYPIYGKKVGLAVSSKQADLGIVICGTGIGISIAANKVPGIRAANVSDPLSAALSKRHNDANILAMGARIIGSDMAKEIVSIWLNTDFEGGRHKRRIAELTAEDNRNDIEFNRLFEGLSNKTV